MRISTDLYSFSSLWAFFFGGGGKTNFADKTFMDTQTFMIAIILKHAVLSVKKNRILFSKLLKWQVCVCQTVVDAQHILGQIY